MNHLIVWTRRSLFLLLLSFVLGGGRADGQLSTSPEDWPQWRGPNRDGISLDTNLLKDWPEGGPKIQWRVHSVGVGYSSIAVKDGRIFTQGDLDGVEHIICLSAEDGNVLWAVQPAGLEQILDDRVRREFERADRDGNSVVDEAEAWQQFGRNFINYDRAPQGTASERTEQRATRLIKALDKDGDGQLDFAETGQILRDAFGQIDAIDPDADILALAKQRADSTFAVVDANRDGKVTRDEARNTELSQPFNRIDREDPSTKQRDGLVTKQELFDYYKISQKGRDGVLTHSELRTWFARVAPEGDGIVTQDEVRGIFGGYRNGMGDGPRGTPTVDGDRVYVEGGNGDVSCLNAATGKSIWRVQLVDDFGGRRPGWGYSESPLLEGNLLIVTPGGKDGTLIALDKMTGEVVWRSEGVTEAAHYSSPTAATIGGIRQIVQFARESVFGVDAGSGQLLWKYSAAANSTANAFTPIIDGDLVFASSAYGTGTGVARISTQNGQQVAEEVYFLKRLQSHHGGAVKIGEHIYSNGGGTLMCVHFATGEIAWQARSVGKGSLVAADGMLYVLSERQEVALVEAQPNEYAEHGRFKFERQGRPSWAHPVVCGGRLYIRDQNTLTAYDIRKQ